VTTGEGGGKREGRAGIARDYAFRVYAVDDADEVRSRALAAGANGDREPYDAYGSRNAWIVDPFGHRWGLLSPLRG